MHRKPTFQTAILFILFTFLVTWGVNIPLALAAHHMIKFTTPRWIEITSTLSPGFIAIILTGVQFGRRSLKDLLLKIFQWKIGVKWYIFAVLVPPAFVIASLCFYYAIYRQPVNIAEWYLPFILFFIFILFSPLWEEIGWRGFLLPILQSKFHPLLAAVILGLIWGVWHVPMYFVYNPEGSRTGLFLVFFILGTIPLTVVFVWLFNSTKGSLLLTIVFHSSLNATFSLFFKTSNRRITAFYLHDGLG